MSPYSPERRTALVLCGTGAHGAYHAGVLRALQEAGVKIDVLAGRGVGAATAALAAIDGAARLWDGNGIWASAHARGLYRWTRKVRSALAIGAALAVLTAATLLVFAVDLELAVWWRVAVVVLFAGAIAAAVALVRTAEPLRRRASGAWWWRVIGAPVDPQPARATFADTIWELIRGAAPAQTPAPSVQGRRFSEVLLENLGQPGFRELILVATDLDARRDVVAALLREPYRGEFLAPRPDRDRPSEVLDLGGMGRDHAIDVVAAALTPPLICEPALVTFARDSFWRGETHRLCDRPGSVNRLLEEVAVAGVTQVIVVTAVAPAAAPHRLRVPRLDLRSRLGEYAAAGESASLRDALEMARLRFDSVYLICPVHNPVGPFDFAGAYDEASDRRQDLQELMDRAYEDAYRQFIEPVVGASGEHLGHSEGVGAFDDGDVSRVRDLH